HESETLGSFQTSKGHRLTSASPNAAMTSSKNFASRSFHWLKLAGGVVGELETASGKGPSTTKGVILRLTISRYAVKRALKSIAFGSPVFLLDQTPLNAPCTRT